MQKENVIQEKSVFAPEVEGQIYSWLTDLEKQAEQEDKQ